MSEAIVKRVMQLVALAKAEPGAANENEARTAAFLAARLIREHGLVVSVGISARSVPPPAPAPTRYPRPQSPVGPDMSPADFESFIEAMRRTGGFGRTDNPFGSSDPLRDIFSGKVRFNTEPKNPHANPPRAAYEPRPIGACPVCGEAVMDNDGHGRCTIQDAGGGFVTQYTHTGCMMGARKRARRQAAREAKGEAAPFVAGVINGDAEQEPPCLGIFERGRVSVSLGAPPVRCCVCEAPIADNDWMDRGCGNGVKRWFRHSSCAPP